MTLPNLLACRLVPPQYAEISSVGALNLKSEDANTNKCPFFLTTTSFSPSPTEQALANSHLRETKHQDTDPPSSSFPPLRDPIFPTPFLLSLVPVMHTAPFLCRQTHDRCTLIHLDIATTSLLDKPWLRNNLAPRQNTPCQTHNNPLLVGGLLHSARGDES